MSQTFDRRTDSRYPVYLPLPVRITPRGSNPFLEDSILQNISEFGLKLLLTHDLPVGSHVLIEVHPDHSRGERRLVGHVVRREVEDRDNRVGIAFQLAEQLELTFTQRPISFLA